MLVCGLRRYGSKPAESPIGNAVEWRHRQSVGIPDNLPWYRNPQKACQNLFLEGVGTAPGVESTVEKIYKFDEQVRYCPIKNNRLATGMKDAGLR